MDIPKLQTAIFEKTGIRLDRADPVFALVALNEVVIANLLEASQEQWTQNTSELDVTIGALTRIHEQILAASKDLTARVNQAHLAAALQAAAAAKAEIFAAARDAVTAEVGKAAKIITESTIQLENAGKKAGSGSWAIAIVQAFVGGIVAAAAVLTFMYLR